MKTGVIAISFGEPVVAVSETVVPFLERIFDANAALESNASAEEVRARSRRLAEERAPALLEEYKRIGGSPLNPQADAQARAVEGELRERGHDVVCYSGFQFTEPFIRTAVAAARADGVERLVGLPVYPLCGRSTTVAALEGLRQAVAEEEWNAEVLEVAGWHRHPDYVPFLADQIRWFCEAQGVDLYDPRTRLVFSAHGTPVRYLTQGNRYDVYVEELCGELAWALAVDYTLGFQNHTNRPVAWTQPDIGDALRSVVAQRVVVMAVSFMHEQSETLAELDIDLRHQAEEMGLEYHRVPVPHNAPRFHEILADVVEARMSEGRMEGERGRVPMRRCLCRPDEATWCTNGVRMGH